MTLAACIAAAAGCTVAGQEVSCDLGYLGYSRTVDIKVTAKPVRAGEHKVTAVVLGDYDKDAVNNEAAVDVTVLVSTGHVWDCTVCCYNAVS